MAFFSILLDVNGRPLYFCKSSLQKPRHNSLFYADRITFVWCTDTDTYTLWPPHTAKAHNTHANSVLFLFFLFLFVSILIRSKLYTERTHTLAREDKTMHTRSRYPIIMWGRSGRQRQIYEKLLELAPRRVTFCGSISTKTQKRMKKNNNSDPRPQTPPSRCTRNQKKIKYG